METAESPTVSTYTLAVTGIPISGPLFLNVFASSVTVNWSSGTAAGGFNGPGASYLVQVSAVANFSTVSFSSTTYNLQLTPYNLLPNTVYYFRVQAYNAGYMTDYSWQVLGSVATLTGSAPSIASITPSSGFNNTTINITDLAGTEFISGAAVKITKLGQTDINASNVTVVNANKITCTLPINGIAQGDWDVVVTNPNTQSATLTNGFTVILSASAPIITSLTPGSGFNNTSLNTTIAGSGFGVGAAVKITKLGQTDITASSVTVVSANKITCTLPISGIAAGAWNVTVTNPDTQSYTLVNGFTVLAAAPSITSLTPDSGFNNASVSITNLAGTGFASGTTVKLSKSGQTDITGSSVTFVGPNKLTCVFNLTGAATGKWSVIASVPGQSAVQLTDGFNVMTPMSGNEKVQVRNNLFDPVTGAKAYIITQLQASGMVTIKVYNSRGTLVRTLFEGNRTIGAYSDEWDGKDAYNSRGPMASGMYLIRIEGPGIKTTKRVVIVK